jgi:Rrf2 family protein
LASRIDKTATLERISVEESMPKKFLAHIASNLRKAGIIESLRGVHGGIMLAKMPEKIHVLEIINAIEGPLAIYRCLNTDYNCERTATCPLCGVWAKTQKQIIETLSSIKISDLVANKAKAQVKIGG